MELVLYNGFVALTVISNTLTLMIAANTSRGDGHAPVVVSRSSWCVDGRVGDLVEGRMHIDIDGGGMTSPSLVALPIHSRAAVSEGVQT